MGGGTCNYTSNDLNQYTAAGATSYQYDDGGNEIGLCPGADAGPGPGFGPDLHHGRG